MSQGQRSRSKCQKLQIASSVIVTYILINPQQYQISSFWVARYHFLAVVTLILDPWPWNWTMIQTFWRCIFIPPPKTIPAHSSIAGAQVEMHRLSKAKKNRQKFTANLFTVDSFLYRVSVTLPHHYQKTELKSLMCVCRTTGWVKK